MRSACAAVTISHDVNVYNYSLCQRIVTQMEVLVDLGELCNSGRVCEMQPSSERCGELE